MPAVLVFLICGATLFSGCSDDAPSSGGSPSFSNPIITTDDFFAGSNWNDPHVIHDGTRFVMYASASVNFDGNVKIYRLTSPDGIGWTLDPASAVLEKSASVWDSHSVETPAVVYYNGGYHLFYTGYSGTYAQSQYFKIGHAVSADGISWTKDASFLLEPTDPTGAVNFDFNQFIVGEPAPVVFNGKIYLYFTAVGASVTVGTTWQVIGLATYDGTSWTAPQKVLEPDLAQYPRASYVGYSTPNAVLRDGKIHLYYDVVADPWKQVKIHHAVSDDGLAWTQDTSALLDQSDFSWTAAELRSPSALPFNGKLYLYFAGHAGTDLSIGLRIY
jgi:predicted GH43/DUF377 family glycosyl hydrolase